VQAADGNFYGTTFYGGTGSGYDEGDYYYTGTVFKITPSGMLTTLYNFCSQNDCTDGSAPASALIQATDGNFYGTTSGGGADIVDGTVFEITPSGTLTTVDLVDLGYGNAPLAGLVQGTNGALYGTTYNGGTDNSYACNAGCGTVFSLSVGLGPFVSLASTSGKVGKTIEVLGQGFTGTTAVSFNGTPATYTVVRDTYLKATVPSGATTGFVTVTTTRGTLTSNKPFRVHAGDPQLQPDQRPGRNTRGYYR